MGKATKIGIFVIPLIILILGGYLWYSNWKANLMQIPPNPPSDLIAASISATQVKLTWKDKSINEDGFLLYRDGKRVAELPKNTKSFEDNGLRPATSYSYEIKSFNQAGESATVSSSVTTLNPPIADSGEIGRLSGQIGHPVKRAQGVARGRL